MKPLSLGLACLLAACATPLETERQSVDTAGFGSTVITLVCKRIAHLEEGPDEHGRVDVRGDRYREICRQGLTPPEQAPASLRALLAERAELVTAIDAALPEDFLPWLQAFLTTDEFLSIYDDGTALAAVDAIVAMLRFAAEAPDLPAALERLHHRVGYRPMTAAVGTMRAVARYPALHDFLATFLAEITEGGRAREAWRNLSAALSIELRHAAPVDMPDSAERTGHLARQLLFRERALLGTDRPIGLAGRDHRGVARVARDVDGQVLPPFVDADGDGLADVDELGRFVDESGAHIAAPTPFAAAGRAPDGWPHRDGQGRALAGDTGELLYEYVDLDRTVFGALVRDAMYLFDPDRGTALDAVRGASALMGARRMAARVYSHETLIYRGYDADRAPLLDMIHGYLQILRDPRIDDTLALARVLLGDHEAEMSRLFEAVIDAARRGDAFPALAIDPAAPLWDDLMPVLRSILEEPGLVEELWQVLQRPELATLGQRLADYMTYTDSFSYHPVTQEVVGSLGAEVDRARPDSNFNRSLMQRLVHLVADAADNTLCNKDGARIEIFDIGIKTYDECELLRIDDVASFYVRALAYRRDSEGNFEYRDGKPVPAAEFDFNWGWIGVFITDGLLESMIGIDGFRTHPTPQALNRTLFLEPPPPRLADVITPPVCRDGHLYTTGHGGTLPVWEATGFYELVQPLAQPFVDRDRERLFVDLIVVLHKHWPSRSSLNHQHTLPGEPNYAYASDLAAYEPLMAEILGQSPLLPALVEVLAAIDPVQVNNRPLVDILLGAARYVVTPHQDLRKRDGSSFTTTADGRLVPVLSPWHILADAYARKHEQLAAAGPEGAAWPRAVSEIVDVLVRGDMDAGAGWRFRNPRARGVLVAMVDFLRERLAVHRSAGDVDAWLADELPERARVLLGGPVFVGAADLVQALHASPEARRQLEALASYLTSEVDGDSFRIMLTGLANLFHLALADDDIVPIAHLIGEVIDPERGWLDSQLVLAQRASESDRDQALVQLLRNLYAAYLPGRTPLGDILDGVSEVHRDWPHAELGAPYSASDYQAFLRGVARFLDDEKRGLRRFIAIMEGRHL